jgi:FMN phosphatase YigB (HAD superfamily)
MNGEAEMKKCVIKAVLFDFGGVLADEGFRNGLIKIAEKHHIDPDRFASQAREVLHSTGYITGKCDERAYWEALRGLTGISGTDRELSDIILQGFTLREWMFDVVERLKEGGIRCAILSDQTNWLDELEEKTPFFFRFEDIFNSYHVGKCKKDQSLFVDVLRIMHIEAEEVLFVDDTYEHIVRANNTGLKTLCFKGRNDFLEKLDGFCPGIMK